jgi:acetolactate synthase-1/2/3 large subunit
MNRAELIVNLVSKLGVRKCFTVSGGMAMFLNKALHDHPTIESVFVHHEQAAVCAAEGYTKANNFQIPGLACVTSGPGIANTLTGLLSAFADSAPVVVLAGQVKEDDINVFGVRTHGVQEIGTKSIFSKSVKQFISMTSSNLSECIEYLCEALFVGRRGPIIIEMPLNLQQELVENAEAYEKLFSSRVEQLTRTSSVEKTFVMPENIRVEISKAKRLSVMFGNGFRISGANIENWIEICDDAEIPRFYTWASCDLEDSSNALNMNCPGSLAQIHSNRTLQESDCVIFIGARLDLATTAFQRRTFGASGKRIIIDIDKNELSKFGQNSSDFLLNYSVSDVEEEFLKLLKEVDNDRLWVNSVVARKNSLADEENTRLNQDALTVRDLAMVSSEFVDSGKVIMSSSGYASETFARFYHSNGRARFFHGGGLGAMGQGLANGIGAMVARMHVDEKILIVESDGGLLMSVHELATYKHYFKKGVLLVNLNNSGYASIFNSQQRHFSYSYGSTEEDGLFFPKWEQLVNSFGIEYIKVTRKSDLGELKDLFLREDALFIDYIISKDEPRGPALKSTVGPNGITSTNLEDIDW